MITLADIFDLELFDEMVAQRYVRLQTHPTLPLTLANYSELAQFNRVWNDVTTNCRGLVYETDTKQIVSRTLRKFHNWGEPESEHLDLNAPVEVTDKVDGSMIAVSLYNGEPLLTSRGSFQSEQAIHAAKLWEEKYRGKFEVLPGWTYIFEVIYPTNRIVLDYGDMDDLVMLAAIDNSTGRSISNPAIRTEWLGPSAKVFEYKTLAEALAAEPRPNAEGFVVHFLDTDERCKLKYEAYVQLHRIVTGLNERTVWQHMVDGKPIEELIEPLPDEFHEWVKDVYTRLCVEVDAQYTRIFAEFSRLRSELPEGYSRKDFAIAAMKSPNKWALFALLDGRDIEPELLKRAKPEAITPAGKLAEEESVDV